jgi:hypothetical protein
MKLHIPHSDHSLIVIEINGPDVLRRITASTEHDEYEPVLPEGVDERTLSVKAWYVNNAGEPVCEPFVIREAEVVEPEPDPMRFEDLVETPLDKEDNLEDDDFAVDDEEAADLVGGEVEE